MRSLNQNLVELVKLLSDGEYHDGTSIGHQLNITRAAVWKVIKKLEEYEIPLTSTKGKGYRLESALILLDANQLKSLLRHSAVKLNILEKTTSTNDYLKQLAQDNKAITVCLAEMQSGGKGRLHRQWYSPFAENIYLSMRCPFEKDISELSGLSLVIGLAVCHAIETTLNLRGKKLTVKWPNDVIVDDHKLAGTLIEMQAESNGFCQVIIGVGVNVNMRKALKKNIGQPWTSLLKVTDQYVDRNVLGARLIDSLIDYLERFSLKGLAAFADEWRQRDCLCHATISVVSGNKKFQGVCTGINQQGHLTIKTEAGDTLMFSSGDTTLMK